MLISDRYYRSNIGYYLKAANFFRKKVFFILNTFNAIFKMTEIRPMGHLQKWNKLSSILDLLDDPIQKIKESKATKSSAIE